MYSNASQKGAKVVVLFAFFLLYLVLSTIVLAVKRKGMPPKINA